MKQSNNLLLVVAISIIVFLTFWATYSSDFGTSWCASILSLLSKQFDGVLLFATGIALTLCVTAYDEGKKVLGNCSLFSNEPAMAARLKTIFLILIAVVINLLEGHLKTPSAWSDALLAFNSALAGVYAGQGWPVTTAKLSIDSKPTDAIGKKNNA